MPSSPEQHADTGCMEPDWKAVADKLAEACKAVLEARSPDGDYFARDDCRDALAAYEAALDDGTNDV